MMSQLELRQIIESGFLPTRCVCSIGVNHLMTISLYHPDRVQPAFVAHNLNAAELTTSRAISSLVHELRQEYSRQAKNIMEERHQRQVSA
ncbi:DUF1652 domain-containing protein [Pseudomonas sp. DTU_2021_1001937_2_SI_NGA_ILE_001]|uniref:DUF1652 domain-containing protein n=1 Tax=Pseudomonas sp. DTU_2021_1001937_2_SI_NGA_ILE_001 TaxID=3077589 RepID=UPI0028FC2D6D|nr:DUF1652 domain-containing protein [Pseudomonas sp. DTU_2021_1001937_2_SI_NGA_ILE_001]WNW14004.1 DUF1652 domain-containing protein [Pseudomonas sp. DTU_2021_1001937_2_SI_NGA_ILE_001]